MKNIVFMGTCEFSASILSSLVNEPEMNVSLIITKSDKNLFKSNGRISPVRIIAQEKKIEIYEPNILKTVECFNKIKSNDSDFIVVASYGKILPKEILEIPKIASINVHASLLPKFRGASPIQTSIMMGEKETGITIMLMDVGVDTGDILSYEKISISPTQTSGNLKLTLGKIGGSLLISTLKKINNTDDLNTMRIKQNDFKASFTTVIKKSDGRINWNLSANEINNFIRSMNPWPIAFTFINEKKIRIYEIQVLENFNKDFKKNGILLSLNELIVACGNGDAIKIMVLSVEGKKIMNACDFVRGCRFIKDGDYFI